MRSFSLASRLVLLILALASPLGLHGADPLSTWHLRHVVGPNYLRVEAIAYGNGVFVAPVINPAGVTTVLQSSDGNNWTRYLPSGQLSPGVITFANGMFFSGSAVSTNGLVWATFSGNRPNRIASNGQIFVGIDGNNVYVSTNGIQWDVTASGIRLDDIAFGAGLFVIIGEEQRQGTPASSILTSQDGRAWAIRRQEIGGYWGPLTYGNGRFVVSSGLYETNLISTDGITWNGVQAAFSPWKFLGEVFVTQPYGTNFFSSVDGVSFATKTFGTNIAPVANDMAYGNGTMVAAVNNGGAQIWQSDPITNSPPVAPALAVAAYPGLTITGTAGREHRIEYRDALATNGVWNVLTNVVLPSSPWLYFDQQGFQHPSRYYRAVAE